MYRNLTTLFIFFLTLPNVWAQATIWAPEGATWVYSRLTAVEQSFIILRYEKDTLYEGQLAKKINFSGFAITGSGPDTAYTPEIMLSSQYFHQDGEIVKWYNDGDYKTIYDFSTQPGEGWELKENSFYTCDSNPLQPSDSIYVTSIDTEILDGKSFDVITIGASDYWSIGSQIVKGIGSLQTPYPIPAPASCADIDGAVGRPEALMLYYDDNIGCLDRSSGYLSCSKIITSTKNAFWNSTPSSFTLAPNPTNSYLNITADISKLNGFSYSIYDVDGRLQDQQTSINNRKINVTTLQRGVYFIVFNDKNGATLTFKILKNE